MTDIDYQIKPNSQGGFLIPEIWYMDIARPGFLFRFIRWIGNRIIDFGARIHSLGYSQKEVRPHEILKRMMENGKIERQT